MKEIVELLAAAAAAAVAAWSADKVVHNQTGKHIHEHVFEWWCKARDDALEWINQHPNVPLHGVFGIFVEKVDNVACGVKKRMDGIFKVRAYDTSKNKYFVTDVAVSREEVEQKFPELKTQKHVLLEGYL